MPDRNVACEAKRTRFLWPAQFFSAPAILRAALTRGISRRSTFCGNLSSCCCTWSTPSSPAISFLFALSLPPAHKVDQCQMSTFRPTVNLLLCHLHLLCHRDSLANLSKLTIHNSDTGAALFSGRRRGSLTPRPTSKFMAEFVNLQPCAECSAKNHKGPFFISSLFIPAHAAINYSYVRLSISVQYICTVSFYISWRRGAGPLWRRRTT